MFVLFGKVLKILLRYYKVMKNGKINKFPPGVYYLDVFTKKLSSTPAYICPGCSMKTVAYYYLSPTFYFLIKDDDYTPEEQELIKNSSFFANPLTKARIDGYILCPSCFRKYLKEFCCLT